MDGPMKRSHMGLIDIMICDEGLECLALNTMN